VTGLASVPVPAERLDDREPMSEADSLESWPEMHERYADRFGVDPEIGRAAFAQHHTQQHRRPVG
jgi:hypothetical protein